MHDIRAVRADADAFDAALARRGVPPASAELLRQDAERRRELKLLQERQARRNTLAREVAEARRAGRDSAGIEAEATALRVEMDGLEARAAEQQSEIRAALASLPNVLDAGVPDGRDERTNV
ncbi:MAG: serine--tRNA ligase, partial [Acetobacteraceae bacterium]